MTTAASLDAGPLAQLAINTVRFLFVDAMGKANSGHPGLPLGAPEGRRALQHIEAASRDVAPSQSTHCGRGTGQESPRGKG